MAVSNKTVSDFHKAANTVNLISGVANQSVANKTGVSMGDVVKNQAAMNPNSVAGTTLYKLANNANKTNVDGFPDAEQEPKNPGTGGSGSRAAAVVKPAYTAATLPSATSQESYINALYDANAQKQKAALEAQYTANVGTLDQQAARIPGQYDAAANQAAAQAAINRANFNEQAAATGLNTGATGQAALAQNNALLGAVSEIRKNQADALNDVEMQRASLQQQYQAAIKEAIANNEADRAAALYNESKRVDESLVSTAVNQATENYRAWQAMYK